VLSDLHVGSQAADSRRFEGIVNEVLRHKFDLLLLPGDFVNMQMLGGGRVRPETIAQLLAPIASRVPTIAVMGNHDAEYGIAPIVKCLSDYGIVVLFNESTLVRTEAGDIHIAGVEDHSTGNPDVLRALDGIPKGGTTIVLAHDPAIFADVPPEPSVTVCGHTHGGQICLPFLGPVVNASSAPLAWTHGHIVNAGRHLVVSAGLGTSGLPWRWNCPPEIVEVKITIGTE
jgi:predicted MPP superfamily phosphohydrolase